MSELAELDQFAEMLEHERLQLMRMPAAFDAEHERLTDKDKTRYD